MTAWKYSNTAVQTTLSNSYTAVDTSIVVASVTGFPVTFPYTLVFDFGAANAEVVNVTAAAGTTLTVTRGQDGTSAGSHASGAVVAHALVARDGSEPSVHINTATDVHGLAGGAAVVGTTSSQTLTNKTLTSPTITTPAMTNGTSSGLTITTPTYTGTDSNFTLQDNGDATKQGKFELSSVSAGQTRTLTFPNVSTTIVGTDAVQTLTNKTISGINTISVADNALTVQNVADATKQMQFSLAGLTTATTRTLVVPDANLTIVGTATTQTLTNKTLTTPAISSPTITGTYGRVFAKKTADETINNVGTIQNDDDLVLALEANATYMFELRAVYNSGTTPDFFFNFLLPASGTLFADVFAVINATTGIHTLTTMSEISSPNLEGSGADRPLEVRGIVITAGTSGNMTFRWAQLLATVSNTVVKAGSYMFATRVQ